MALIAVAPSPIAILRSVPSTVVHAKESLTFWFFPSMVTVMTVGPPPPLAAAVVVPEVSLLPEFDLLLEQPEIAATRIAAPATAIVSSLFTCAPLPDTLRSIGADDRLGTMRVNGTSQIRVREIVSC
jgi:hypothetical protein